ncbi:MAG: hypothetical protein WA645_18015, partial [Pseudolabrys sp.]
GAILNCHSIDSGWRNTHQVRQAGQERHSRNGGSGNIQSMVNATAFPATVKAISISINMPVPSNS